MKLKKISGTIKKISELLLPHLQAEEDTVTIELLNSNMKKEEIQELHDKIKKSAQKGPDSKMMIGLIIYSLDDNERNTFYSNNQMPSFVTKFIFPVAMKKTHEPLFPFLFNPPIAKKSST